MEMAPPRAARAQRLCTPSAWARFPAPGPLSALPFHRSTCNGASGRNQHSLSIYCELRTLVGTSNPTSFLSSNNPETNIIMPIDR